MERCWGQAKYVPQVASPVLVDGEETIGKGETKGENTRDGGDKNEGQGVKKGGNGEKENRLVCEDMIY